MIDLFREMGFAPLSCVWELTLRCNLNCRHCGSRAGKSRGEELSREELLRVADELMALGNQRVTLSGGEPLLNEHWPDLARHLSEGGVAINMISNGYAFGDREAKQCVDAGLSNVGFSLDGDERTHTLIRRRPDSYRRVLEALDACARVSLPTTVVTHINNANRDQLAELPRTLLDHGVSAWQLQLGFDAGNLSDHPELLLAEETIEQIVPEVVRMKQELAGKLRIDPADDMGYYTEEEPILRQEDTLSGCWLGCRAGLQVVGIEANGNVKGCLSMQRPEFVEGNLREESLETIWTKEGNFAYTRGFTLDQLSGFCRQCRYAQYCRGGCSWNAYLQGGKTGRYENHYCLYRRYAMSGRADEGCLSLPESP